MVTREKHFIALRCFRTRARERSRFFRMYPNAAHPRMLGIAKMSKPGQPNRSSMSAGRYIPMHHVQEHAQKIPQPRVENVRARFTIGSC